MGEHHCNHCQLRIHSELGHVAQRLDSGWQLHEQCSVDQGNMVVNEGNLFETPTVWANNLAGSPTSMPFSGTSHLWGGIGGMNAVGSGGELDFFTAYVGAAFDACFYRNVTTSGYVVDNCLGSTNSLATTTINGQTIAAGDLVSTFVTAP